MTLRTRFLDLLGTLWLRAEAIMRRLNRRLRRQRLQIEADARQLQSEARQLGVEIWDRVDDLPFFPSILKMPPLANQFYGHGAFMGAGPALLADPKWRLILAYLMPDVFKDIEGVIKEGAETPALIPMFENNPVMAAFGTWRSLQSRRSLPTPISGRHDLSGLEWDVFLDGEIVHAWRETRDGARPELLSRLVDTMLIAHASTTDTVQEAIGLCQYQDVRKTRKSALGGVEVGTWMDFFARALLLASAPDLHQAIREMSCQTRVEADEECRSHAFSAPFSVQESISVFRKTTGRSIFSVVLEIKSLRSDVELMSAIISELNQREVHVAAVGSFIQEEIRGLSAQTQRIAGKMEAGPREILFLHFAGDLQDACERGEIPPGLSLLFNGASLLEHDDFDGDQLPEYRVRQDVVAEIEEFRAALDLHIGLYVQEGDCDLDAAALLTSLVGQQSRTFELGFAWGGLHDEVTIARGARPRLGYGSQKSLEYLGKAHQWRCRANESNDNSGVSSSDKNPSSSPTEAAAPQNPSA